MRLHLEQSREKMRLLHFPFLRVLGLAFSRYPSRKMDKKFYFSCLFESFERIFPLLQVTKREKYTTKI